MSADKPNVLVLCTGNSCRSQMAEGYLRSLAGGRFDVASAGVTPKDRVHPLAVQVMAEDGIDISRQRPRDAAEFVGRVPLRYVIIVCDRANASCPAHAPGLEERLYWPFDDPDAFEGPPAAVLDEFRRVRNQIRERIAAWLPTL